MGQPLKIVVGSKNPVKIEATRLAFKTVWPEKEFQIVSVEVPSGVSAQPMNDAEAIQGACNRARSALEKEEVDFGVGLEGGLHQIGDHWFDCGWVSVMNKDGHEGIGSTQRIITPPCMIEIIKQTGKEFGAVADLVFNRENVKQAEGHFGLMTNNAITRTEAYKQGVIVALARFLHPELF